jgi:hypothetical protein
MAMNKKSILSNVPGPPGRNLLIAIAIGLIGAVGGFYFGLADETGQSPWNSFARSDTSSAAQRIELGRLQTALAAEVEAREELAARIAELEARLSPPGSRVDEAPFVSLADSAAAQDEVESDESEEDAMLGVSGKDAAISKFDDAALLALGAHPRDVERLHDRWVRFELDKESLSNQALREGWFQQQRHRGELIGLELVLRRELEDADYDRYLYALGRNNRLEAGEVLAGSSASDAGLRRGDIIVRYDDLRIFNPGELMVASSASDTGGSVALEVLRDGRRRTLYVRRGPLGALVEHSRAAPLLE